MHHLKPINWAAIVTGILLTIKTLALNAQEQTVGLFLNSEASYNGYTLLGNNETTYLIDNCGLVVNQWQSAYKTGHGMHLLENGDLLRAGQLPGSFDAGGRGGIFELFTWEGDLKWSYSIASDRQHAHHDIAVLPDGSFLCTVWERHTEEEAKAIGRMWEGAVWSESIYEIEIVGTNEANIIWEWHLWDHLIQDIDDQLLNFGVIQDHPELLNINAIGEGRETSGNWLHINALDYNPQLEQIVISSRNLNEIFVIDHSTTTIEASGHEGGTYGKGGDFLYRHGNPQNYNCGDKRDQTLFGQHDIQWMPPDNLANGQFLLFNNEWHEGIQSQVLLFRSPDENGFYDFEKERRYGHDTLLFEYSDSDFYSDILSGVQPLPNGNFLITEGRSGHIFEIKNDGELVWDYVFPVNRNGGPGIQGGEPRFNMVYKAIRYDPEYTAFRDKLLSGDKPVELSPFTNDCQLYNDISTSTAHNIELEEEGIRLWPNPVNELLNVRFEQRAASMVKVLLYNSQAELIHQYSLNTNEITMDVEELHPGIYFITFVDQYHNWQARKFIKL